MPVFFLTPSPRMWLIEPDAATSRSVILGSFFVSSTKLFQSFTPSDGCTSSAGAEAPM